MYMGGYRKLILFFGCLLVIPAFQNCAPMKGIGSAENSSLNTSINYKSVQAILDSQCLACHSTAMASNGNVALDSYQSVMDSNIVVGGNADASSLYTSVENGSMPQGMPPLSDSEVQTIRSWINAGAPDGTGSVSNEIPSIDLGNNRTVTLPIDSVEFFAIVNDPDGVILNSQWTQQDSPSVATLNGTSTTTLTVSDLEEGLYVFQLMVEDDQGAIVSEQVSLTVSADPNPPVTPTVFFAADIQPILTASCTGCHGGNNPSDNYNLESYAGTVAKFVNPGNAASSALYTEVQSGDMPRNAAPLAPADIMKIQTWINEGALDN